MDEQYGEYGGDSYLQLLDLEELESLQEELEESGLDFDTQQDRLPASVRERLSSLGITSMSDLINRLAQMHAEMDGTE